jgi:hypothetical protein
MAALFLPVHTGFGARLGEGRGAPTGDRAPLGQTSMPALAAAAHPCAACAIPGRVPAARGGRCPVFGSGPHRNDRFFRAAPRQVRAGRKRRRALLFDEDSKTGVGRACLRRRWAATSAPWMARARVRAGCPDRGRSGLPPARAGVPPEPDRHVSASSGIWFQSIPGNGPGASMPQACLRDSIHWSTRRSSRVIGRAPPPSTASWKPRMSKRSPSCSSAFRRSSWIRIMPIL